MGHANVRQDDGANALRTPYLGEGHTLANAHHIVVVVKVICPKVEEGREKLRSGKTSEGLGIWQEKEVCVFFLLYALKVHRRKRKRTREREREKEREKIIWMLSYNINHKKGKKGKNTENK